MNPLERRAVLVGAVAVFVAHVVLGLRVDAPFMFHDEFGYLAVARWIEGGVDPELFGPVYHPGYGIVLTPVELITSDPFVVHTFAQLINAACAAALVPVLYSLGRRMTGADHATALTLAVGGATTAALLTISVMVVAESLVTLLTAVSALLVLRALDQRTTSSWALTGVTIGLAYFTHPRALALVVALVVCLIVSALTKRVHLLGAVTAGACCAAMVVLTAVVTSLVVDRLYPLGPTTAVGFGELVTLAIDELPTAIASAAGTVWYATVTTLGLAVFGGFGLLARVSHWRQDTPRSTTALYMLLAVAGSLGTSVLLLTYSLVGGPDRLDFAVYGRYVENWLPALIVLAPGLQRRWMVAAALSAVLVTAAGSVVLRTAYDPIVWDLPVAWHNIAGLYVVKVLTGSADFADAGLMLVAAVGAAVLLIRFGFVRLVATMLCVVGLFGGMRLVNDWAVPASLAADKRHFSGEFVPDADSGTVTVDVNRISAIDFYNLQFWDEFLDLDLVSDASASTGPYALSTVDAPPAPHARLAVSEVRSPISLWVIDDARISIFDRSGDLFPPGFEADYTLTETASQASVRLTEADPSEALTLGDQREIEVEIRHIGEGSPWTSGWSSAPVRAGTRLWDLETGAVIAETRAEIDVVMTPGDRAVVLVPLPDEELVAGGGSFVLEVGVLQHGVRWFTDPDADPLLLRVLAG